MTKTESKPTKSGTVSVSTASIPVHLLNELSVLSPYLDYFGIVHDPERRLIHFPRFLNLIELDDLFHDVLERLDPENGLTTSALDEHIPITVERYLRFIQNTDTVYSVHLPLALVNFLISATGLDPDSDDLVITYP